MKKYTAAALAGVCLLMLTGCQSGNIQGGNDALTVENETADAVQEAETDVQTNAVEENGTEPAGVSETAVPESAADAETVEYGYEDLYLSVDIPDGWGYRIRTAQEMAKEDGLVSCAITFWPQEYPAAVFSLEYMQSFGMCGTGVTIEEFSLSNGLSAHRYTEEIEDTLWLTITLSNPNNMIQGGTYCIDASPDLTTWDAIKPEFEEILETVWVGPRPGETGAADASQSAVQPQLDTQSQSAVQPQPDTQSQSAVQAQPDTQSQSMAQPQTGTQSGVTLEQAKSIALADAGLSAADVTFIKEELDYDHGIAEYEIEFVTSTTEYEYEMKADDGTIIKTQQKPIAQINEKAQAQSGITLEQAKAAALEHAGVTESQVVFSKLELGYDDGIAEYEIEFYLGKKEYSYEIDASTGKILEAEVD